MVILDVTVPLYRWLLPPWNALGLLLLGAGAALHVGATGRFRRHRVSTEPLAWSRDLVTDGPYRFSRNPMYLGGVVMLAGIAVVMGSLTPLVVIPVFVRLITGRFIVREEAMLAERFGAPYEKYRLRVGRWW